MADQDYAALAREWLNKTQEFCGYPCGQCADGSEPSIVEIEAQTRHDEASLTALLDRVAGEAKHEGTREALTRAVVEVEQVVLLIQEVIDGLRVMIEQAPQS